MQSSSNPTRQIGDYVAYSAARRATIDFFCDDDRTHINGKTLDEVRQEYPDAERMHWTEARAKNEALFVRAPREISEDAWDYALNVLPPMGYTQRAGADTFKMVEFVSGRITHIYCRLGGKHYELADMATLTHEEIVAKVRQAFPSATP